MDASDEDGSGSRGRSPDERASPGETLAELREEVGRLGEELMMHRKALEQCLEVRDGCMELLAHREAFSKVLELREGVQAVLGSSRIINEIGDRTAELDLSLAGVSESTARHGIAIGKITDQQQRLSTTMEAVVRAVKRLDRSRSRGCGSGAPSAVAASAMATPLMSGGSHTASGMPVDGPGATNGLHPGPMTEPAELLGAAGPLAARRPLSAGHGRAAARAASHRPAAGFDDIGVGPAAIRGGDADAEAEAHPGSAGGATTAEMADCVQGVLARIEEALTKLDGCRPAEGDPVDEGNGVASSAPPVHAPESWDPGQRGAKATRGASRVSCVGSCRATSARRPSSRGPQVASAHMTPDESARLGVRGALEDTPRIFTSGRGCTPRGQRPATSSTPLSPRQYIERLTSRGNARRYPEVWA